MPIVSGPGVNGPAASGPAPKAAAIIVAAGRGERAGGGDFPKQFRSLLGRPILAWSIRAFAADARFARIIVVTRPEWFEAVTAMAEGVAVDLVAGGTTRTGSVRNGLVRAAEIPGVDHVFIHDAARPGLDRATLDALFQTLREFPAAIPVLRIADALVREDGPGSQSGLDREGLCRVQTPQAFHLAPIMAAFAALPGDASHVDDAAIARAAGLGVGLCTGTERLMKVTHPGDFAEMEMRMGVRPTIGNGFDVHEFEPGDHVILCGIRIPYSARLKGHSDADAGFHALTDALLGAISAGDIGDHFPPTEEKWRGAPSDLFLAHARDLVLARGGRISNVDLTIICEAPKVKPFREAMRAETARVLGLAPEQVGIKATTTEGLGFTGRREGLAALGSACVLLPDGGGG